MEVIKIDPTRATKAVDIGQAGENEAAEIQFDISAWVDSYGAGNVFLYHQREDDEAPYLKLLPVENNIATWVLDDIDTSVAGVGAAQLNYVVSDKVKKTLIFATYVNKSLGEAGETPDPYEDLLEQARAILSDTNAAKNAAQASAADAEEAAEDVQEALEAITEHSGSYSIRKSLYTTTQASETTIPIGISNFSASDDTLIVYISGLALNETEYSISGTDIVLNTPITTVGTEVQFVAYRGSVVVDPTLTVSGAAADAKVTGDEITGLKSSIEYDFAHLNIEGYEAVTASNILSPSMATGYRLVSLSGSPYSSYTITANSTYKYYTVPVSEGDRYSVLGVAYNNIKAAVIIDENDNLIDYFPKENTPETRAYFDVTIPSGGVTMYIVDYRTSSTVCLFKSLSYQMKNPPFIITGLDNTSEYDPLINAEIKRDRIAWLTDDYSALRISANSGYRSYIMEVKEGESYEVTGTAHNQIRPAIITNDNDDLIGYFPQGTYTSHTVVTSQFVIPTGGTKLYSAEQIGSPYNIKRINCINFIPASRTPFYNPLYSKKLVTCGDSLTAANSSQLDARTQMYKSYGWFVAERNAMDYVNLGISGETLCSTVLEDGTYKEGFSENRYLNIPADSDYITIFYGWNDEARGTMQYKDAWCVEHYNKHYSDCTSAEKSACDNAEDWLSIFIGSDSDSTCHTWYGGWNIVLDYIRRNRPNAKVGVVLPYIPTEIYRTSLIELCKKYGVSWVDGADPREWFSTGRSFGLSADMQTYLKATYTADGLHPNADGHERISFPYEKWIRGL